MRQLNPVNKAVRQLWGVLAFLCLVSLRTEAGEDITTGVALFEGRQFAAAQQFFAVFASRHQTAPAGAYYLGRLVFERKQ